MATISLLLGDWALLASESKRKNANVRLAVEKCQQTAKNFDAHTPITNSTENQIIFTNPFFLALESGHDKLISASLLPIARLAGSNTLTSTQIRRILAVLNGFDLAAHTMETQLKILQILPSVMLNYGSEQSCFLQIVNLLAHLAETSEGGVANAASATLQQIFCSLYDQLKEHSTDPDESQYIRVLYLEDEKVQPFILDKFQYTCYLTFLDLCSVVSGEDLELFDGINISVSAALEDLESIISFHPQLFHSRKELAYLLRTKVVPALLKTLNSTTSFVYPLIIRALRIVQLLVTQQLTNLEIEVEIILLYANHIILDSSPRSNSASSPSMNLQSLNYPQWEKAVVIELYRNTLSFGCAKSLFAAYDNSPGKKNVLSEVFSVLDNYLANFYSSMISKTGLFVPGLQSTIMTKHSTNMKMALIDHLEKTNPPASIPEFYLPFLILSVVIDVSNGVAEFVSNMSLNVDSDTIEGEVEFITLFIETLYPEMFKFFDRFLHFSMDTEFFIDLVAALQRYTHAIGLLGLSSHRDKLLVLLAKCVCNNFPESRQSINPVSNVLSIGETLVDTISSTIANSTASPGSSNDGNKSTKEEKAITLRPRIFHSRLIVCLGALLNLAGSLGSTLETLWKIVFITLQWVDYFLNGPDDYSGYNNQNEVVRLGHPTLSSLDLTELKTMKLKGFQSVLQYQETTIMDILRVIRNSFLNNTGFLEDGISLDACPFNKSYIVKQLTRISELEFTHIEFYKSDARGFVTSFFIDSCTDRSLAPPFRILLTNSYAKFLLTMTIRGFKLKKNDLWLAENFLLDLKQFLLDLFALGKPMEHLTLNCEAEIQLIIFSTLHEHINLYDTYYQNFWDVGFAILNTVFLHRVDRKELDHKLDEKIRQLIVTSFGILKMILDEFLTTLPPQHFKPLIDTLLNYCQQQYDLNISFSSVSYFWLISDCLNSKRSVQNALTFESVQVLEEALNSKDIEPSTYYPMLNTYLLAKLAVLSSDHRSQVREGAIQTLFQILEVQGKELASWQSILLIVFPSLLDWEDLKPETPASKQKDMMVSLNLVLSNLVSVYSKFMMDFTREPDITEQFWTRLLEFLSSMLRLRWCELSLKVFQTYLDLLISFGGLQNMPPYIKKRLYDFWINAPIEYDFVNLAYQDALVAYLDGFKHLHPLLQDDTIQFSVGKLMSNLNKCARYPILGLNQKDHLKPTELQEAALSGLVTIGNSTKSEEIEASVVQQLAHICAYPFETRARIEAKLSSNFGNRIKIPTFVAISQMAYDSLKEKLLQSKNMRNFIVDNRLNKILKSLLFLVRNRAAGIPRDGSYPLWVNCNFEILTLLLRAIDECWDELVAQEGFWELVVECIVVNFEDRQENEEEFSVQQYGELTKQVIPALLRTEFTGQVSKLIKSLYSESFLYEFTSLERGIIGEPDAFEVLCNFDFESHFGTTKPICIKNNRSIRLMCLEEIFKFAGGMGNSSTDDLIDLTLLRVAFSLRRFIADSRLLRYKPLPRIQQVEIRIMLEGLLKVEKRIDDQRKKDLWKLISKCIPFAHRVDRLDVLLQDLALLNI